MGSPGSRAKTSGEAAREMGREYRVPTIPRLDYKPLFGKMSPRRKDGPEGAPEIESSSSSRRSRS